MVVPSCVQSGRTDATHTRAEHALLLDFATYDIGPGARVALELDLASGRALLKQLALIE